MNSVKVNVDISAAYQTRDWITWEDQEGGAHLDLSDLSLSQRQKQRSGNLLRLRALTDLTEQQQPGHDSRSREKGWRHL